MTIESTAMTDWKKVAKEMGKIVRDKANDYYASKSPGSEGLYCKECHYPKSEGHYNSSCYVGIAQEIINRPEIKKLMEEE